jgi:hypothetical protein
MTQVTIDLTNDQIIEIVSESLKDTITDLLDLSSPLHEYDIEVMEETAAQMLCVLRYYAGEEETELFLKLMGWDENDQN